MIETSEALVELGQLLKERRESVGMTLETVFDRTKIRLEYLQGIENGDYTDFPETVYIKGFVRTYLKLIGAEDMQADFMTQLDRTERPDKSDRTERLERLQAQHVRQKKQQTQEAREQKAMNTLLGNGSSLPKGFKAASHFWLFLVLICALIGTGAYVWYAVNYGGLDLRNLKLFSFTGNNTVPPLEISSSDVNLEVEIENVSVDSEEPVVSEEPEPENLSVNPSLEIHAINDVWLSVAFGNASPVYRRTLRRGEVMRWDLTEPARVVIGRPTAAQIILNGKDLGVANPRAKKSETYIYELDGTFRKIK